MMPESKISSTPIVPAQKEFSLLRAFDSPLFSDASCLFGLILLLILEFGLFSTFAQREITWSYPAMYDQTVFLTNAYDTHEQILAHGLAQGLKHGIEARIAQGSLIHLEAAVAFLVLGASRRSALIVNFVHFVLLQCTLVWILRRLSRSWNIAYLGLGLLLLSTSRFLLIGGGLYDFRLDFASFCVFGVMICVVIRSEFFKSGRWSLAAGATAAYLVLLRHLFLSYVIGIVVLFGFLLWIRIRTTNYTTQLPLYRQLRGLRLAALAFVLPVFPVLYYASGAIYKYYFVGHLGPDRLFRMRETGTTDLISALLYYPRSTLFDHLGIPFLILSCLCLALMAVTAYYFKNSSSQTAFGFTGLLFLLSCFAVPLAILTLDPSKSPVVAGVLVSPIIWLVLIPVIRTQQRVFSDNSALPRICIGLVAVMTCGFR